MEKVIAKVIKTTKVYATIQEGDNVKPEYLFKFMECEGGVVRLNCYQWEEVIGKYGFSNSFIVKEMPELEVGKNVKFTHSDCEEITRCKIHSIKVVE